MPIDRDKLTKLLALTTSENDHEVLGCMRAANRMLKANNMTWEDVLAGPEKHFRVSISRTPYKAETDWTAPHLKDKVIIDLMFRTLFAQPRTGAEDFWRTMDGIHQSWQNHGALTQGQYMALKKCYQRACMASTT